MAISANAVWEIQPNADAGNVGGGFFVTGATGVDWSTGNSPHWALTGVTSAGAGDTILSASAHADMVGNGIHTISGTNFTNNSWFEIVSVVAGVSITCSTNAAGASISTGVGSTGVMNVGGAIRLQTSGSSGDDDVFEAGAAGNTYWVKNGTYTLGETVAITLAGTTINMIKLTGYNSTRGDNPTDTSRPTIDAGTVAFTVGASWMVSNIIFTTAVASTTGIVGGTSSRFINCKMTNTAVSDARVAHSGPSGGFVERCELISYRGPAYAFGGGGQCNVFYNYIHDSNIGVNHTGAGVHRIFGNIIADCVTSALISNSTTSVSDTINSNTLYGAENILGTGFVVDAAGVLQDVQNNIIYGFTAGISGAASVNSILDNYNVYYNNTANAANVTLGPGTLTAVNPSFTNVTQITGTGASSSTNVLTAGSGTPFGSVVDGVDFVYLSAGSGTGIALRKFLIVSHTTTDLILSSNITSSGAGSAIAWQITLGHNFLPTGAI